MSIITLTTDWGLKDHYLGAVKGTILNTLPDAKIVDISHKVPPFDLHQASFILKNCYKNFPKGTIHIIGIKSDASIETPHTAILADDHYFVGSDNGIFSLILDKKPDKIVELEIYQDSDYFTFSTRDIFIKAACHLAEGKNIEDLGTLKKELFQKMTFEPVIEDNVIRCKVIYIDSYENVIVNVTEKLFKKVGQNRRFSIFIKTLGHEINTISKSYHDVDISEMLAVFDSNGYLEIAINEGKASSLLGLKFDDIMQIIFYDD